MRDVDSSGSTDGKMPSSAIWRERTVVASKCVNVVNGAGQTGAAIFNNYTNLAVTNNVRPTGDTRVLGTFFGEPNSTRDPRIIQLGIKLYF